MLNVYIGGESDPLAGISFYIVERSEFNGRRHVLRIVDGKTCRLDELQEGYQHVDPTFSLPADKSHEFLKAMAELAYERGIRLKSDETRQGKLEATEKHLADMRRLVFK